jgi:transposase-like protein
VHFDVITVFFCSLLAEEQNMACRTQEEWIRLISEYLDSKESVNAFCQRNRISDSALYYWLAKTKQKRPSPIRMLPVVTPETKPVDIVELLIPRDMSLRFSPGASARYVADIIKALV